MYIYGDVIKNNIDLSAAKELREATLLISLKMEALSKKDIHVVSTNHEVGKDELNKYIHTFQNHFNDLMDAGTHDQSSSIELFRY